jgi:hypothetical protein
MPAFLLLRQTPFPLNEIRAFGPIEKKQKKLNKTNDLTRSSKVKRDALKATEGVCRSDAFLSAVRHGLGRTEEEGSTKLHVGNRHKNTSPFRFPDLKTGPRKKPRKRNLPDAFGAHTPRYIQEYRAVCVRDPGV